MAAAFAPSSEAIKPKQHKELKPLRYAPRVQLLGTLHWLCPACGHIGRARLVVGSWRIKCDAHGCNRVFGLGYRLWQLPTGRASTTPPDAGFPIAELATLAPGGRLHEAQLLDPDIP